jgi:succinate-semialdehyde dehydrogenase
MFVVKTFRFVQVPLNLQLRTMHLLKNKAYINGEWVSARSDKVFEVTNPATGKVIGTAPDMDVVDAQHAIDSASRAFATWQDTTAKERSRYLRNWFDLMVKNLESLAKIVTLESGKPLVEARGEVFYGNSFVEFFSEETRRIQGEIIPSPVANRKILVEKQPIGVTGLITPWNFPHAMITRKAGAALAAGCTCVIKPAEDTPFTALALMELAHEAGFPKGVVNVVTSSRGNAPGIGNLLCQSPLVAGISFTGSTQVGKLLYKQCSSGIKRLGLELGGNAPFIVYKSADVDSAVKGAMGSKFRNCGQTCVAANRFFVQSDIYDSFVEKLTNEIKALKIGNGEEPDVQVGPLINQAQFEKVTTLVQDAVSKGAKVLVGGKGAPQHGRLFYEPTVLTDIKDDMRVYSEEVFGPVVNIFRFDSEEESVAMANNTERGLAGYFYSRDVSQIFRVARKLEVGMCGVNEGMISTAEAPFGGVKESGLGREGSHHGIEEFTYVKYVALGNL